MDFSRTVFPNDPDTTLSDFKIGTPAATICARRRQNRAMQAFWFSIPNTGILSIHSSNLRRPDSVRFHRLKSHAAATTEGDEITVLTSITRDGQDVAYNYELDDEAMDMAFFNDHLDEMKANLSDELEALNSPMSSFKPFMKLLCRTNKNLLYVYKGKHSGQTVTITFTNSELRDIIQDYIED